MNCNHKPKTTPFSCELLWSVRFIMAIEKEMLQGWVENRIPLLTIRKVLGMRTISSFRTLLVNLPNSQSPDANRGAPIATPGKAWRLLIGRTFLSWLLPQPTTAHYTPCGRPFGSNFCFSPAPFHCFCRTVPGIFPECPWTLDQLLARHGVSPAQLRLPEPRVGLVLFQRKLWLKEHLQSLSSSVNRAVLKCSDEINIQGTGKERESREGTREKRKGGRKGAKEYILFTVATAWQDVLKPRRKAAKQQFCFNSS